MARKLLVLAAAAGAFLALSSYWRARRPDERKRAELVERVERCKAAVKASKAAMERDFAAMTALQGRLMDLKRDGKLKEYNELLPRYNADLDRSQAAHAADDVLVADCNVLAARYNDEFEREMP